MKLVVLHPSLVGETRGSFHAMLDSAWCILVGGVWRKPLEILRGEGKACVMGLRHACRSTECLGGTVTVLAGQHGLGTGCFKGPC